MGSGSAKMRGFQYVADTPSSEAACILNCSIACFAWGTLIWLFFIVNLSFSLSPEEILSEESFSFRKDSFAEEKRNMIVSFRKIAQILAKKSHMAGKHL